MKTKIKNMILSIKEAYNRGVFYQIRVVSSLICKLAALGTMYCVCGSYENGDTHNAMMFGIVSAILLIIDSLLSNPGIVLLIPYIISASAVVFACNHNLAKICNETREYYVLLHDECNDVIEWVDELYYRWKTSKIVTDYKLY